MSALFGDYESGNVNIENDSKILTTFVEDSSAFTQR